jgi:hypothetical protein
MNLKKLKKKAEKLENRKILLREFEQRIFKKNIQHKFFFKNVKLMC